MHAEATAAASVPSNDFFLARQPILGRDQHLVAFELLFRAAGEDDDAKLTDNAAATAAVISHASQLGMEQVVGEQLAFVNVDEVVLMSDFVRFLPPHKVILEILETVKPTQALLARVAELKELGFKFAVDDVVEHSPELDRLVGLVDVIKVDVKLVPPEALKDLVCSLKSTGKKLLAEKVETIDEFKLCMELGFEYFQGYYFARPVILSGKKITPSEMTILRLLELLSSDADAQVIETAVKRDALISLNLLRLVNSRAAPGPQIESLSQALHQLGRRQLQRWLQILLYAEPGVRGHNLSPLLMLATTRARLMELLAQRLRPGQRNVAEIAFTVGMMSLMDTLFCIPMQDIVEQIPVIDEVRHALLVRRGFFGELLRLAESIERMDDAQDEVAPALHELSMDGDDLAELEISAFEWSDKVVRYAM